MSETLTRADCPHCPWTGTYRSQAKADYSKRQHSCAKAHAKAAAAARAAARKAAVDRTPKPCQHERTRHAHGTPACYVLDRCRCTPCSRANAAYEKTRTRRTAYGRWNPYVDAEAARAHVRSLMASGMGLKTIVDASGVSHGALWKLIYGKRRADGTRTPTRRVRPATQARILAVQPDLAPGARLDATGTRRRLQALATLGWSVQALADATGRERQAIDAIIHDKRASTTRRTADAVREAYDALWDTPRTPQGRYDGSAISRIRNRAARLGWAPPLAWDDDRIDDPRARPAGLGTPERGEDRRKQLLADVEEMLDQGRGTREIATRLGYREPRYLARVLRRYGAHDLARALHSSGERHEAGAA